MNIAFDSMAILAPMSKNRGISNYAAALLKTMIETDKENKYFFFNIFEDFSLKNNGCDNENLQEFNFWCGIDSFLAANTNYIKVVGDIIKNFIKKNNIDVFFITSPFDIDFFPFPKEWFEDVNVIAIVYDIIPYIMKNIYLRGKNNYKRYMKCADFIRRHTGKLFVISKSVKDDLIHNFNIDEKKIEVIYGAANDIYKKITVSNEEKENLYKKFNIKNDFIMCTGGDDGRKNIKGLIEAYSKIPEYLIEKYQLIIVCRLSQNSFQMYSDFIFKLKLDRRVILTNYVTDTEMLYLYNLTSLMAFPSKYEGFGLPVVEAFACGAPALTSNNSSLGEIAEGAAVLIDPFNVNDMAKGLEFALTSADLGQNIKNGYEKLKKFQWNKAAETVINSINKFKKEKSVTGINKLKIAFFTPLPPLESGISDYSVDILNRISHCFDIDVFIDDGYTPVCSLNENIKIYNHKNFNKNKKYYNIIYQVGNSYFHIYMFPYIQKNKGTVVLHDYNLHSTIIFSFHNRIDFNAYKNYLLEDFPLNTVNDYLKLLLNNQVDIELYEMELNGFVVNYANKIIVHSEEAKVKLLKKNIANNVMSIRHYAKIEPLANKLEIKKKYGYSENEIIFASFGYIYKPKRIISILKAFKNLCEQYSNITYIFAGKLDSELAGAFNDYLQENNLENKVKVTGRIDLDEFNNYIDLTDVCFNLRYPYNGETSGSLMRILAKGKCVVVNNIGSFGEIPDDCCVKLPDAAVLFEQEEIIYIYRAMKELASNINLREKISKSARKYAEGNLDLNIIAKKYFDFISDKRAHTLNEKTIQNIINSELTKEYSIAEIKKLSKTLAYSIGSA